MRRGALVAAAAFWLCACGRYGDFTLPPLSGGNPHATFTFSEDAEPVMNTGEFSDVLNPSVVRGPSGLVNYYSAFDGRTWRTKIADSQDGRRWTNRADVLSPDAKTWEGDYIAANGSALFFAGHIWHWYVAGPRGANRIALQGEPRPVLDTGPYMSWDERAVADPYVIRVEPYFYLYYLGQDRAVPPRQRIGVARSKDGVHWEKLRTNPILELGGPGAFDENGLGEPAVWTSQNFYWLLYTGRDANEYRRLGLARSTDGVHWQKLSTFAGSQAWDAKVICDPTVLVEGSEIRVWFGGGDRPSPDENLHGQIGYGVLRPYDATLAK